MLTGKYSGRRAPRPPAAMYRYSASSCTGSPPIAVSLAVSIAVSLAVSIAVSLGMRDDTREPIPHSRRMEEESVGSRSGRRRVERRVRL